MSRQVIVHGAARFDAIDIAYFIAEDSLESSVFISEALDGAFELLAEFPGVGVSRDYDNPKLRGMRMWPIPDFPNYLIFFQADNSELRVLRILHGARDIQSLFAPDDGEN